jgi:hypothetical protein
MIVTFSDKNGEPSREITWILKAAPAPAVIREAFRAAKLVEQPP